MPEGDTVVVVAARLRAALAGESLTRCELRVPAAVELTGRRVLDVAPRGKHLFVRVGGGLSIHSHLKMDGEWRLYRPGSPWSGPGHEVRAVLGSPVCTAVGYRLGVLEVVPTPAEVGILAHLGPDVLGPDWDEDEALRRLGADPEQAIGDALLDQRVMAGPGNVYRSEVCFLRGLDPRTPVGRLGTGELRATVRLVKRLMEANRSTGTQITTGDTRPGRRQWVYGRAGLPCRRCGTRIVREGGPGSPDPGERAAFRCPSCQPTDRDGPERSGARAAAQQRRNDRSGLR